METFEKKLGTGDNAPSGENCIVHCGNNQKISSINQALEVVGDDGTVFLELECIRKIWSFRKK